jgi:hypothetical protein
LTWRKSPALLLVVTAGGQSRGIAGVDIGEEVGPVVNQGAQIEFKIADEPLGELGFDGLDILLGNPVHVIPEGLAGELSGRSGEQAGQDGFAVPMRQLGFAGGGSGAVEGGQEHILAYGQALVALSDLGINDIDQVQLESLIVESRDVAEGQDLRLFRRRRSLGGIEGLENVVERTEVGGFDDFGFAVHALAVADVVVGVAFDSLAGEARH